MNGLLFVIIKKMRGSLFKEIPSLIDTYTVIIRRYSAANCDSCLVKKSVLGGRNFSLWSLPVK